MNKMEKEREVFEEWCLSIGINTQRSKYHYDNPETNSAWKSWKARANLSEIEVTSAKEDGAKYKEKYGQMIGEVHALRKQIDRFKGVNWVKSSLCKPIHSDKVMIINDSGGFEIGFCDKNGTFRDNNYGEKIKYAIYWSEIPSVEEME